MLKMKGKAVELLAYHVRNMILIVSDAITSLDRSCTAWSQASHLLCMIYCGVLSTCLRYNAVHISSHRDSSLYYGNFQNNTANYSYEIPVLL